MSVRADVAAADEPTAGKAWPGRHLKGRVGLGFAEVTILTLDESARPADETGVGWDVLTTGSTTKGCGLLGKLDRPSPKGA